MDELERERQLRAQYDSSSLESIRREKEMYNQEIAELERKIKDIEKEKNAASTFQSNKQSDFKKALEDAAKDYEKLLKAKHNQHSNFEEEEQDKRNDLDDSQELKKKEEKHKPVRFVQIEQAAKTINRRLRIKRIKLQEAVDCLFINSLEEREHPAKCIDIATLENNLRREPFCLQRKENRLVARYLVEDNAEEDITFNPKSYQTHVVVGSIFKTMVGPYQIQELKYIKELFKQINAALKASKMVVLQALASKDKKDVFNAPAFEDRIEKLPPSILDLNQECKDLFILHCIERSDNCDDIKIERVFELFTAKEFESLYDKNTGSMVTLSHLRSGTQSELGRGRSASAIREEPGASNLHGKKTLDHSDSSVTEREEDDEADDAPPPKVMVNEVTSFNDPSVKEKILSLEELKAAGQVKGAFSNLIFGMPKKADSPDKKQADQPAAKEDKQDPSPESDKQGRPKKHGFQINFNNVNTFNDEETVRKLQEEKAAAQREREKREKEEMEKRKKLQMQKPPTKPPAKAGPDSSKDLDKATAGPKEVQPQESSPPKPVPANAVQPGPVAPLAKEPEEDDDEDSEIGRQLEANKDDDF